MFAFSIHVLDELIKTKVLPAGHPLVQQIEIDPAHQHRAAFNSKWGLFESKVMPFGLANAPSMFQCFMNEQLVGLELFARVYVDEIIVFSRMVHEHLAHLR